MNIKSAKHSGFALFYSFYGEETVLFQPTVSAVGKTPMGSETLYYSIFNLEKHISLWKKK